MATSSSHGDDQLLRRTFDAIYDFDIHAVTNTFSKMNRRTRWYLFSAIGVLMLVVVVTQMGKGVVSAVRTASLPTANESLVAPYELNENMIQLDTAALPTMGDFTQTPVELATVNPVVSCMADYITCSDAQLLNRVDLESGISANYANETMNFSLTALQFANQAIAQRGLENLYDYSSATGAMGNYVIMPSQSIRYYYGLANGWLNFTWAADNAIYTVNVRNFREMESVMELLRTAPPVITEGLSNG
ncbi:MAG: hypothetical protein RLP44_25100 [Aggregatilineales bacterium]